MPHKDPEARRAWAREWYSKNKDLIKSKSGPSRKKACKNYRKNHPDRCKAYSQKYYTENKNVLYVKVKQWWSEKGNERKRNETESLTDNYIKRQLRKDGFSRKEINEYPELIKTKRNILKIKRLCKTSQN